MTAVEHAAPPPAVAPAPATAVPVEDRAEGLWNSIAAKHIGGLESPLERYIAQIYWRSVLTRAAQMMTASADFELAAMADEGLSYRKISALLAEAGCILSRSGVEQAVTRARAAEAQDEADQAAVMEP